MAFFKLMFFIALFWLEVAGIKSVISPSYLWPLRFIYNKKVPVVPPLDIHGEVTNADGGLHFDGKTAWLDAGELTGSCIAQPDRCVNGLSVALRVKLRNTTNTTNGESPQFLFDSGGFNGQGVSLYIKKGVLNGEVADKKRFWRTSTNLQPEKWHFVLLTWSAQDGVMLFVDGPIKAQNSQPMNFQLNPVATSNHVILGRCNAEMGSTFAEFSSDLVAVFDSVTPDGKIYLSYSFSAPSSRGNIRYVNAKFINTADFDLTIFPDRGEHQKEGYQLEARSSTLLEYVLREGPLPIGMNFRIQNKMNGEQLRYNGKYDFHVISSDDKQVIKEYKILQDATILAAVSTGAVSINYQIRPATVSIEPQINGSGVTHPGNVGSESQSTNEQNALIDNPENPLEEEKDNNITGSNVAPTAPNPGGNKAEQNQTSTNNGQQTFPHMTTTIAPTVPPPPQYTTMKPNMIESNKTKTGVTVKPNAGGEVGITSPELPDDEQKLVGQEAGMNGTNMNETLMNGTDSGLDSLLNGIEPQNNTSGSVGAINGTLASQQYNATNVGSSNGTETGTQGSALVNGNQTSNATKEPKRVTNEVGASNGTEAVNASSVGKGGKETLPEQNIVNLKPTGAKKPAIASINSPNPWIGVAKETQGQQQQKPVLWHNGQGIYEAMHANDQPNNIATVNYNREEKLKLGERPVWQYLNEPQGSNQWFANNKFKTDTNTMSTSPFKFANTKTQQETMSFHDQKKNNKVQNKQTDSINNGNNLSDLF